MGLARSTIEEATGHLRRHSATDTTMSKESTTNEAILAGGSSRCTNKMSAVPPVSAQRTAMTRPNRMRTRITLHASRSEDRPQSRGILATACIRSRGRTRGPTMPGILEMVAASSTAKTIAPFLTTRTRARSSRRMSVMAAKPSSKISSSRS